MNPATPELVPPLPPGASARDVVVYLLALAIATAVHTAVVELVRRRRRVEPPSRPSGAPTTNEADEEPPSSPEA
jgi:hypothetical protein